MTYPAKANLKILQGATWSDVRRWGVSPIVYKDITAATNTAPLTLTVPSHGLLDGWWFAVTGARGMSKLNAANNPPTQKDYMQASVTGANSITVENVNAKGYGTYTGGGTLQYATPVDLTGYSARMQIKESLESDDILLEMTTANGLIVLDTVLQTITFGLTAAQTAALTWTSGVYQLEMVLGAEVTRLLAGKVTVSPEGTR